MRILQIIFQPPSTEKGTGPEPVIGSGQATFFKKWSLSPFSINQEKGANKFGFTLNSYYFCAPVNGG